MTFEKRTHFKKQVAQQMLLESDKLQPQAIEIEESILGAILLGGECLMKVITILKPEIFYKEQHQRICEAILSLHNKKIPVDIITVTDELKRSLELENVGGAYYVAQLTNRVASAANIEYHIRIVLQLYIAREIIQHCSETIHVAYEGSMDVFELLDDLLIKIESLDMTKKETIIKSLSNAMEKIFDHIDENYVEELFLTGSDEVDNTLRFEGNSILLIGGKSGSGKTSWLAWLMNMLLKRNSNRVSILWCNMEDDTPKMIRTFISQETGLTDEQLKQINYILNGNDLENIKMCKELLNSYDIEFIDTNKHIAEISKMFNYFCHERKKKFGDNHLCILILDNIMLLKDNSERGQQTEKDDRISMAIKQISIDTNQNGMKSMIILMHHFTSEQKAIANVRTGYRPREEHLKGSTRYVDISTKVALINRPENYTDLMNIYKHMKDIMRFLFIVDVTKNRNSKTGIIRFFTEISTKQFKELNNKKK